MAEVDFVSSFYNQWFTVLARMCDADVNMIVVFHKEVVG